MGNLLNELRNHTHNVLDDEQPDTWPDETDNLISEIGLPTDDNDAGREIIRSEYTPMVNTVKLLSFRINNAKELGDIALLQQAEGQRVILARRILAMRRAWPWLID